MIHSTFLTLREVLMKWPLAYRPPLENGQVNRAIFFDADRSMTKMPLRQKGAIRGGFLVHKQRPDEEWSKKEAELGQSSYRARIPLLTCSS